MHVSSMGKEQLESSCMVSELRMLQHGPETHNPKRLSAAYINDSSDMSAAADKHRQQPDVRLLC